MTKRIYKKIEWQKKMTSKKNINIFLVAMHIYKWWCQFVLSSPVKNHFLFVSFSFSLILVEKVKWKFDVGLFSRGDIFLWRVDVMYPSSRLQNLKLQIDTHRQTDILLLLFTFIFYICTSGFAPQVNSRKQTQDQYVYCLKSRIQSIQRLPRS